VETVKLSKDELAKMIDSTIVKPFATKEDIAKLCREAQEHGFGCVCVNPTYVAFAVKLLKDTQIKVCSTIGFPDGTTLLEVKAFEAEKVVKLGAEELDMVMNISAFKSRNYELVKKDIRGVTAVKELSPNVVVKVIIETAYLNNEEKVTACRLVKEAGADFVKTSTGIYGKATVEDVRLMRKTVGENFGVKAAGGIRTYEDALSMIKAGANRIGTSTAVSIIKGASK